MRRFWEPEGALVAALVLFPVAGPSPGGFIFRE
jgi:hypothetical protein